MQVKARLRPGTYLADIAATAACVDTPMEFNIRIDRGNLDLAGVERHLQSMDPAALADFDAAGGILRLSTALSELEIATCLRASGHAIDPFRIERQPSTCCGGCGG